MTLSNTKSTKSSSSHCFTWEKTSYFAKINGLEDCQNLDFSVLFNDTGHHYNNIVGLHAFLIILMFFYMYYLKVIFVE